MLVGKNVGKRRKEGLGRGGISVEWGFVLVVGKRELLVYVRR